MKLTKRIFLTLTFVSSLLLQGCHQQSTPVAEGGDTIKLKYATLLTMVRHGEYTEVTIADPWNEGKALQRLRIEKKYHRALVFTTVHCQLMEYLGCGGSIAGVCDLKYINIDNIRERSSANYHDTTNGIQPAIVDCGNAMAPNIEKITALKPDIMILSPFEGGNNMSKYKNTDITMVYAAEYMEPTPLARAEWMKLYGLLFGCEKAADSLFCIVDSTYNLLKKQAIKLPKGRSILTERKTGATWYCPGGKSTVAQMIADANGQYAFAGDNHSGSLALPFEQVFVKAGNSDIWAFKYEAERPLSRSQLLTEFHGYAGLKAMQTGEVYQCNAAQTTIFEETGFRPDLLLREFIILLHPETDFGKLRYYKRSLNP